MSGVALTTADLYRDDPYARTFSATVLAADDAGIVLDRTLFYPQGGGQPGDVGTLVTEQGIGITIADTARDADGILRHRPARGGHLPTVGETVRGSIDWSLRYPRMRIHTCLHLLSAVIPAGVTGGSIGDGHGRLDFDLPAATLEREAVDAELNRLIEADHLVTTEWITAAELDDRSELIKTLSVQPPRGADHIRLVRIGDIDLQPCGGTHVASTAEIGPVRARKIEKKSRHNRRVSVVLAD